MVQSGWWLLALLDGVRAEVLLQLLVPATVHSVPATGAVIRGN